MTPAAEEIRNPYNLREKPLWRGRAVMYDRALVTVAMPHPFSEDWDLWWAEVDHAGNLTFPDSKSRPRIKNKLTFDNLPRLLTLAKEEGRTVRRHGGCYILYFANHIKHNLGRDPYDTAASEPLEPVG